MEKISVFDTSISDYNLGNQIIMDAVYEELSEIFPQDFFFKLPVMEITPHTLHYLRWSKLSFMGGTNALSNQLTKHRQWDLRIRNFRKITNVVLLGVGWRQYEHSSMSWLSRKMLTRVLSATHFHSVRDGYTEKKMRNAGFTKILNTGCPTLWKLDKTHCSQISEGKSNEVVFTLTDYHKDIKRDHKILECLSKNYEKLYFWSQGAGDLDYFKKNFTVQAEIIKPNLRAFDQFLQNNPIDYVGTRLHAGLRALKWKRRACIVAIDNRATEMSKDFSIPIVPADKIDMLNEYIHTNKSIEIHLPVDQIQQWKAQFDAT